MATPSPPMPTSTATFTLFPYLPTELRLKIWQHTLSLSRILKISYSPTHNTYISNTPPPITLSINHESRSQALLSYSHLILGCSPNPLQTPHKIPLIPFNLKSETLYISSLAPILQTHAHELLYNLSTSPSRHLVHYIAFDLRTWNELCDIGLLAVLARMRGLQGVDMVVEFGRGFKGEVGFLEAPEWRGDLRWVAERAGKEVGEERGRGRVGLTKGRAKEEDGVRVRVRCVILTRGGEQA